MRTLCTIPPLLLESKAVKTTFQGYSSHLDHLLWPFLSQTLLTFFLFNSVGVKRKTLQAMPSTATALVHQLLVHFYQQTEHICKWDLSEKKISSWIIRFFGHFYVCIVRVLFLLLQ